MKWRNAEKQPLEVLCGKGVLTNFIKRETLCFPVNLAKFLRSAVCSYHVTYTRFKVNLHSIVA